MLAHDVNGVHVGELHLIFDRLNDPSRLCGCGVPVAECEFWAPTWQRVLDSGAVGSLDEALALYDGTARFRAAVRASEAERARFGKLMAAIYAAIAIESGNRLIVDSSKHPMYFRAVQSETQLAVFHLVRDPRGVAYSWSIAKPDPDKPGGKMEKRSPVVVALEWLAINGLAEVVTRSSDIAIRKRLEQLVDEGLEPTIRSLKLSPLESSTPFSHTVAGNPLRHDAQPKTLTSDDRWIHQMARSDRLVVSAIATPLLHRMGYSYG